MILVNGILQVLHYPGKYPQVCFGIKIHTNDQNIDPESFIGLAELKKKTQTKFNNNKTAFSNTEEQENTHAVACKRASRKKTKF
jgi:hypothetical protein